MKIRDAKTKEAFIEYLRANPEQRFLQAVTNFVAIRMKLGCWSLCICKSPEEIGSLRDVFPIEGDEYLIEEEQ